LPSNSPHDHLILRGDLVGSQQRAASDHDSCASLVRLVVWMPLLATFVSVKLAGHLHFWTDDPRTFTCGLLGSNLTTAAVILQVSA
jgi:hypothetical protein